MHPKSLIALIGAIAIAGLSTGAALAAAPAGPTVTVQVKTLTKTLLNTTARGEKGSITKGGTPKGVCPGKSATGALDAATHGKWKAKYYASVAGGIFVTSILGVKPTGSDFWALFVNGKESSKGSCLVKLKAGETLAFKIVK